MGKENVPTIAKTRNLEVIDRTEMKRGAVEMIDKKFGIGKTVDQLHHMMKEVTAKEINANTVNAACNCIARLNETMNTTIEAAKFLSDLD